MLVGYQGWFRCPGDGSPANQWSHWSRGVPSPNTMAVDLYPETNELKPSSRCLLPGVTINGKPAYVFSSFSKDTVEKHFEWMRTYEIDGVLLQRFINSIHSQQMEGDTVLRNVRSAAEVNGRLFSVEYDLSGAHQETALKQLQDDWGYLTKDLKVTSSPAYLRDHGKPIVAIWGLGFGDADHLQDPALGLRIVKWFKDTAHVRVIGGVPAGWRTLSADSSSNSGWAAVYSALDIVQPWSVGRYRTLEGANQWKETHLIPDLVQTRKQGQSYMPVIFPGFSWHNLNRNSAENQIPRLGGRFLWKQAFNAKTAGATFVKIAMFDEVNEGTAIFKAAPSRKDAPKPGFWLTLDADGETLPNDWYLKISAAISQMFHGTAPPTEQIPIRPATALGIAKTAQ
ncbi:glycoside hydrolase family 71/99-like protein [Edaphobacter albus]|uniref:glycoside hydrolase family 71/99-like protein n=1 Tax=Edaphobacter sp. 4G125 TaxID=2763071 RepID=UPI001648C39D|nr:glycoside hydrolase family 71/99-like protein [Edaphobacter sp. 4G125]QNI37982.1 xylosidase/arabinosidase [Edaphobacter sp. 4G125]